MAQTKTQMRVRIAKDVLEWVDSKNLIMEEGNYLTSLEERDVQLGETEYLTPEVCRVCAIGAMFCAAVDRHDALQISELHCIKSPTDEDMMQYLDRWFSESQLRLMEVAFEGIRYSFIGGPPSPKDDAARAWYQRYNNAETRMRAIMNNVIKNKGEFIP